MSKISLIIPVFNEAKRLGQALQHINLLGGISEIIVVDGGSDDATVEIARAFAGVRVLRAPRGRALQMNAGAAIASGDVLLFLHADVGLPANAGQTVERVMADTATVAGAFKTWTINDRGKSWLDPFLHFADLRSRYSNLPYGDQAIFVRAEVFNRIGGYMPLPLMEDLDLARRLRQVGKIKIVDVSVVVSGRRFLSRPLYYVLLMNLLPLLYRLGVPPAKLAKFYGTPR